MPGERPNMATFKPSSGMLLELPLVMWKPQAHSQAPCVGFEVKGPVGEKVQGHTTVQLQFSRKSPTMCQRVCVEAMRHLHVVSYSSVTSIFCVSKGHFLPLMRRIQ